MSNYRRLLRCLFTCALCVAIPAVAALNPPPTNNTIPVKSLGTLNLPNPIFAAVNLQDDPSVVITSLPPSGKGTVYTISNLSDISSGFSSKKPKAVPGRINWPNDATEAPAELFGSDGMVVGGGSLLPGGSSDGGIYYSSIVNGVSQAWLRLASKSGWFYHHVVFADLYGSGKPLMVTCRSTKHAGGGQSTLVILKPQDPSNPTGTWDETELGTGCNAVAVADLDGDGHPEIATVSSSKLSIYYSTTTWEDPSSVKKTIIDSALVNAADVQIVDMNGDGHPDLLVADQRDGGSVFSYHNPGFITATSFTRYLIASGFSSAQQSQNQRSLGSLVPFQQGNPTPLIALAGGAAQIAYILVPSEPFKYNITTLYHCHCTVGKLAVADVDRDGNQEVFVPCTGRNQVAAFSFGT